MEIIINKKGFTLAEVLITLAIIGVVAAMSIPGLINDTQNQEHAVALKKAYATTNIALQKAALDSCGTNSLDCLFNFPNGMSGADIDATGRAIAAQFNVNKICGLDNISDCLLPQKQNIDGTGGTLTGWNWTFTTADGMGIGYSHWGICDIDPTSPEDSPMRKYCGQIYIDTNGKKGPNTLGRDAFSFYITSNKVPLIAAECSQYEESYGSWWRQDNSCGESPTNRYGGCCAARVMEEGWEINY